MTRNTPAATVNQADGTRMMTIILGPATAAAPDFVALRADYSRTLPGRNVVVRTRHGDESLHTTELPDDHRNGHRLRVLLACAHR